MDNFNIHSPKIETVTINSKIELNKHKTERFEFNSASGLNRAKLKKWSNFTSWEFTIYKTTETLVDWNALVDSLQALNTGEPMLCEVDTVNNAGTSYLCMFDCYYDKVSDFPVRKVICNLYRVYSNDNEV